MADPLDAFRLDGRVAVVTGAASGIARATAELLAAVGGRLVLGDVDVAGVEAAAAGIATAGGHAVAQRCDVSRRADVDALIDRALALHGRLDVLCNIAGVPSDGPLAEVTDAEFDRVVGIHVKGTLYGCQAAVRAMREGGSIVNVASAGADLPTPGYGLYSMAKSSVIMLTQVLAAELGPRGIRVNAIAPGAVVTNFTLRHLRAPDGTLDDARLAGFVERMRKLSPLGRVGEPIDQARLILYLASDASRWCTGQIWRANGGQALSGR
jgi:3-oxoacyl-[acyl-carrier protein] reductase